MLVLFYFYFFNIVLTSPLPIKNYTWKCALLVFAKMIMDINYCEKKVETELED